MIRARRKTGQSRILATDKHRFSRIPKPKTFRTSLSFKLFEFSVPFGVNPWLKIGSNTIAKKLSAADGVHQAVRFDESGGVDFMALPLLSN